jgi:hypothetical protein
MDEKLYCTSRSTKRAKYKKGLWIEVNNSPWKKKKSSWLYWNWFRGGRKMKRKDGSDTGGRGGGGM